MHMKAQREHRLKREPREHARAEEQRAEHGESHICTDECAHEVARDGGKVERGGDLLDGQFAAPRACGERRAVPELHDRSDHEERDRAVMRVALERHRDQHGRHTSEPDEATLNRVVELGARFGTREQPLVGVREHEHDPHQRRDGLHRLADPRGEDPHRFAGPELVTQAPTVAEADKSQHHAEEGRGDRTPFRWIHSYS